jgi:hypothetical protein
LHRIQSAPTVRCTTPCRCITRKSPGDLVHSLIQSNHSSDTNCKKLALRGDELSANLHAVERRLDLPRQTCTITDDSGDTIFVNEVQPKPTSPGHDYGRSSPTATSAAPDPGNTPPSHASLSLCHHGYNSSPPLIFMRRLGLQSMTRTLPYTAKYNSSLIVAGLYKYSTQYLTRTTCL